MNGERLIKNSDVRCHGR